MKDGVVKKRGIRVEQLFKMVKRVTRPEVSYKSEVDLLSKNSLQIKHERLE